LESYSLYDLNEYIKRVVALNFSEAIWVHAEISQVNEKNGQYYISLIQKEEDGEQVVAHSNAVIWYKSFLFLQKKLGKVVHSLLEAGTEVRLKVKIDYHERFGLKLVIEDIDPKYTLGQIEMRRQAIIEKLESEGLTVLNERIALPSVIQNVAVISSATAAGYLDFCKQIEHNRYGYFYHLQLFPCTVQGHRTKAEVSRAIQAANKDSKFDCIVIVRGGGSKLDLSAFDDFDIGKAIAQSSLPVITGIGHQIDNTVADLVAHTSIKTPTAVADFLVEHNMSWESRLLDLEYTLIQNSKSILKEEQFLLLQKESDLVSAARLTLSHAKNNLNAKEAGMISGVTQLLQSNKVKLKNIEQSIKLLDPINILKRGFALIQQDKRIITSIKDINFKSPISVKLVDGKVDATPIKKK